MVTIKDIVKGNKVEFAWYQSGELWYRVNFVNPVDGERNFFEFPVPISTKEVGNTVFHAEDKAMLFMRYIRKHLVLVKEQSLEHKKVMDG